jgi:hypothetical protein
MYLRLDDPSSTNALVRFLRQGDYLAVAHEPDLLEVVPLNPVSERGDRLRLNSTLASWQMSHPHVVVELIRDERWWTPRPRRRA